MKRHSWLGLRGRRVQFTRINTVLSIHSELVIQFWTMGNQQHAKLNGTKKERTRATQFQIPPPDRTSHLIHHLPPGPRLWNSKSALWNLDSSLWAHEIHTLELNKRHSVSKASLWTSKYLRWQASSVLWNSKPALWNSNSSRWNSNSTFKTICPVWTVIEYKVSGLSYTCIFKSFNMFF